MAKAKSTITLEEKAQDTIIKAIDLGNYNIKTDKENIFSSTFALLDAAELGVNILEFDGLKYTMDVHSSFDNEFNKSKKNYLPNLFWALHKDGIPTITTIKLVLGTPIENTGLIQSFKNDLEGKTFNFAAESKEYKVTFEKVAIVGEGLSSFYMLPNEERKKDIIIQDIGGGTTNVVGFRSGKVVFKLQVPKGMISVYDNIKEKYNNLEGGRITPEDVKRYIQKGFIDKDLVSNNHKKFLGEIANSVNGKCDIKDFEVWNTGGGSEEMKETIGEDKNFMAKPLFTNVLGNKKVAEKLWSNKND